MADTPHSLYGKMLAALSTATAETISALCLKKSQTPIFQCLKAENGQPPEWLEVAEEGRALLGGLLIRSIGEYPNVANESSLLEILEPNAHPKYSLSPKASLGILTRADRRMKDLPLLLSAILKLRAGLKKTVVLRILDEPPTESIITPINQELNDPCHSLGATNAGRAIVIRAAEVYPIRDPQLNRDSNGFVVGGEGAPAPTLSAMERHAIAACFAPGGFGDYKEGVGTLRASAGKHGISSANIVVAGRAAGFVNTTGKAVTGTLDSNYHKGTGARSGVEREVIGVIKPDYIQKNVGDLNELVTCYAPSSYGTYKEGFGPLRQTGFGDSENLIVIFKKIAYWIKYELRKLTPLECERLQGFPDYWTKYGESGAKLKDTPRYKALGNSLTVPCAERVFRGIIAVTSGNVIKKDSEV